jgi:arsenite oxidase small subunit
LTSDPPVAGEWFVEQGSLLPIPIVYRTRHAGRDKGHPSKEQALTRLRALQRYIGWLLLLSAAAGIYLLATDKSLWILAVSHAAGLVMIVVLDVSLGILNLTGARRVYLASLAAALLGIILQFGDILTAPQYNMTVGYFASYLFGLVGFDVLLLLQGSILVLGLVLRSSVQLLAARRRTAKELNYSRRSFITTIVGLAALIGFGVTLGSIKIPSDTSSPANNAKTASPTTAIANTSYLQVGTPVYFDYPSGYPNILFKRSDGTLAAFSLLCTHVCCETTYESTANVFYCPCHGSEFDSTGRVIRGPASSPLPTITLSVDSSGDIYPTGVSGYSPC